MEFGFVEYESTEAARSRQPFLDCESRGFGLMRTMASATPHRRLASRRCSLWFRCRSPRTARCDAPPVTRHQARRILQSQGTIERTAPERGDHFGCLVKRRGLVPARDSLPESPAGTGNAISATEPKAHDRVPLCQWIGHGYLQERRAFMKEGSPDMVTSLNKTQIKEAC